MSVFNVCMCFWSDSIDQNVCDWSHAAHTSAFESVCVCIFHVCVYFSCLNMVVCNTCVCVADCFLCVGPDIKFGLYYPVIIMDVSGVLTPKFYL